MALTLERDPNLLVEVDVGEMQIGRFCEIEEREFSETGKLYHQMYVA